MQLRVMHRAGREGSSCTWFLLWREQAIRRMSGGGAIRDAVWILRVHEGELESQLQSGGEEVA